ncbi:DUF2177 family protein [Caballeronia sp. LjRoot31]|uniref:DUF2177 family protein n=1 Tax=Caballeronia sp. LjRoot31 TaxID=3342324 RepID=UPI003ECCAFD4
MNRYSRNPPQRGGVFYVIYIAGRALPGQRAMRGLVNGTVFGIVGYATYDLTSLVTPKGWSTALVLIGVRAG